jgi:lysophospholipase L1-like esterase
MIPYDWSDPSAYRHPAYEPARVDHGGRAGHAFWERLPFPGVPWTRVLLVGIVCFGLWFLLDAPSLQHSAQTSPLGTRRTVSMEVVGPVAALSRTLGLENVVGWTDEAFGRSPGGGPALAVPIHRARPKPPTPALGVTTTPTTLPILNYHPTPASPLRVLVVGDSVGLDLGQPLVNALGGFGDVTASLDGRIDTGLSRPDYFNWPAELKIDLANQQPQLVVVMIGANDPQGLVTPDGSIPFGKPGWDQAYSARVAAFIAEANDAGAHVLWVGMPSMQNPVLDAALKHLNALVQTQVADTRYGGAAYLSSVPVLGDQHHNYTAYLTNASGAVTNIRTPDGIHLTPDGGARLAAAVVAAMEGQLHIQLVPGIGGTARRS